MIKCHHAYTVVTKHDYDTFCLRINAIENNSDVFAYLKDLIWHYVHQQYDVVETARLLYLDMPVFYELDGIKGVSNLPQHSREFKFILNGNEHTVTYLNGTDGGWKHFVRDHKVLCSNTKECVYLH